MIIITKPGFTVPEFLQNTSQIETLLFDEAITTEQLSSIVDDPNIYAIIPPDYDPPEEGDL
jgi:hypothetical protein